MEKLFVHISLDSNGEYLADAPQDKYPVGLYGVGSTPLEALADLEKVCVEAKEFCPGLPDFELVVRKKAARPFVIPTFLRANSKYTFA